MLLAIALWAGIHFIPSLGPALADGVRAVAGPELVAWAEDTVYGIEDRVRRVVYRDAEPTTLWEVPSALPDSPVPAPNVTAEAPVASASAAPAVAPPEFPPSAFKGPFDKVSTPSDGLWLPIQDPRDPRREPTLYKAMVHPDPKRPYTVVALIAIDATKLDVTLVAGTSEPESSDVPVAKRPGLIPSENHSDLVAAFNGGFKATHGHYGMMIDGAEFLPPRDIACTIAMYRDKSTRIQTWTRVKPTLDEMAAYRQTPPCLVEDGKTNPTLNYEYARGWGAAVSGDTVIRRSAIGISKSGKTLYYAFGESVTAQAVAHAMEAVGVESAAELDVNYSYPRFVFYGRAEAGLPRATTAIVPDIKFRPSDYVSEASSRDFFFVTHKRALH